MRCSIATVCIMILAGFAFALWPDLDRQYELTWFWHERIEGCKNVSEFRGGTRLIKTYRPRGLSRAQYIQLFGSPAVISKTLWRVDGKESELDDLAFQKPGQYDISLIFDGDTCISMALMSRTCSNPLHWKSSRPPSLQNEFMTGTYSQPGYQPTRKYECVYRAINKPTKY